MTPSTSVPEVLLPVQFYAYVQRRTAWTGAQRLMAALLEDALDVCTKPDTLANAKRRQLQREAMGWLRSNDRARTFSFLRVCEALDLDPGTIRRAMRRRCAEACPPNGPPGVTGGRHRGGCRPVCADSTAPQRVTETTPRSRTLADLRTSR